jgi:hypothetical protein
VVVEEEEVLGEGVVGEVEEEAEVEEEIVRLSHLRM